MQLPTTDPDNLPTSTCYISSDQTAWLVVDHTPTADGVPFCGLTGFASGQPSVALLDVTPGWYYFIVIVY